jgi:membrane protein
VAVKDRLAGVPVLGTALQVQERYKQDAADQLAAAIGFFGFLSLFPLMILAVAVAGFVLTDPAEQARVATLITESIPGFEATLGDDDTAVSQLVANVVANRGAIGIVGLVTLLLTGLRVVNSAMTASTVVFRAQVPTGIKAKLWQVLVMVVLGVLALGAVVASTLAGAPADLLPRWAALLLALGISFGLDTLLFLAAYRLLRGDALVGARDLLPGALLAAVGWTALKVAGASYVGNQVEDANALYGALGGVIALLLLLYLAGRLYLYGAQLSAVLLERRAGPLEDLEEPLDRSADTEPEPGSGTDEPGPRPVAARSRRPRAGRTRWARRRPVRPRPTPAHAPAAPDRLAGRGRRHAASSRARRGDPAPRGGRQGGGRLRARGRRPGRRLAPAPRRVVRPSPGVSCGEDRGHIWPESSPIVGATPPSGAGSGRVASTSGESSDDGRGVGRRLVRERARRRGRRREASRSWRGSPRRDCAGCGAPPRCAAPSPRPGWTRPRWCCRPS